jgi:hypothetical protein
MSSVAVYLLSEIVTGAMAEEFSVASFFNHVSDSVIDFTSDDRSIGRKGGANAFNSGVPRCSDYVKDFRKSLRDTVPNVAGASEIAVAGTRQILSSP